MHDPFIMFRNDLTGENLFFTGARAIVTAWSASDIEPAFAALQEARAQGRWVAGYVSYEAGIALEPALHGRIRPRPKSDHHCPLLCFGIFDTPQQQDASATLLERTAAGTGLSDARPRWDFATYRQRFDRLRDHLHAGDCFQANLTFEYTAHCEDDPIALFNALRARQAVGHSALVRLEGPALTASFSRNAIFYLTPSPEARLMRLNLADLSTREIIAIPDAALPRKLAISADERWLVAGPFWSRDNLFRLDLIEIANGKRTTLCELEDIPNPHLQFDPGNPGRLLVQVNRGAEFTP